MNKYLVKAITDCGYIIYTVFADSLQQAQCIMKNKMLDAGLGDLEVIEVDLLLEHYQMSIGLI